MNELSSLVASCGFITLLYTLSFAIAFASWAVRKGWGVLGAILWFFLGGLILDIISLPAWGLVYGYAPFGVSEATAEILLPLYQGGLQTVILLYVIGLLPRNEIEASPEPA